MVIDAQKRFLSFDIFKIRCICRLSGLENRRRRKGMSGRVCVCVSGTKIESPLCQAYFRTIFNFISSTREAFSNNPHPPPMNGLLSQMHFLIGYVSSVWRKWRAGNADRLHVNYMMPFDQRRLYGAITFSIYICGLLRCGGGERLPVRGSVSQ